MNAFENIVALFLEESGYWVGQSVKVYISREDKRNIGLPSMPRPEIDLVALNVKENILLLLEVKSFLDSYGVKFSSFSDENEKEKKRYRLLTDKVYQRIVTEALVRDYAKNGLITESVSIRYALAAGKIYSKDEDKIKDHFEKHGWILISPDEIKEKIRGLANKGWEDNVIIMTTKLLKDIRP